MCGISGSNELEKAYNLYKLNLARGAHSSGMLAFGEKGLFVHKVAGVINDEYIENAHKLVKDSRQEHYYFLFHSRAPTNSTNTEWSPATTHPFKYENCWVAHNGILTNFNTFEESKHYQVDSQIIPEHLVNSNSITQTFSRYEGLFTCWVVWSNQISIVKAGSSLWMDDHSFSSTQFDDAKCIEEDGVVFNYNKHNGFIKHSNFPYNNPYFI